MVDTVEQTQRPSRRPSWLKVPDRFKGRTDPEERGRMTLLEHLAELRHRILVCVLVIFAGSIVVYFLYNHVLTIFLHPYCQILKSDPQSSPGHCTLYVQDPIDQLTIRLKISFFGGCAIALPVLLWQTWRFITPGLHPNEKRYAVPFTLVSLVLFVSGGFVGVHVPAGVAVLPRRRRRSPRDHLRPRPVPAADHPVDPRLRGGLRVPGAARRLAAGPRRHQPEAAQVAARGAILGVTIFAGRVHPQLRPGVDVHDGHPHVPVLRGGDPRRPPDETVSVLLKVSVR